MTLFSWNGEVDTVLSPIDSIRYNKYFLHSGMMSMDPKTGFVKAYVGGINHKHFEKIFNKVFTYTFKNLISELNNSLLIESDLKTTSLTNKGKLVSDYIFTKFIEEIGS